MLCEYTFDQWKIETDKVIKKFSKMRMYLNDKGIAVLDDLTFLRSMADVCETANEVLELFCDNKNFTKDELNRMERIQIQKPFRKLRVVAALEKEKGQ